MIFVTLFGSLIDALLWITVECICVLIGIHYQKRDTTPRSAIYLKLLETSWCLRRTRVCDLLFCIKYGIFICPTYQCIGVIDENQTQIHIHLLTYNPVLTSGLFNTLCNYTIEVDVNGRERYFGLPQLPADRESLDRARAHISSHHSTVILLTGKCEKYTFVHNINPTSRTEANVVYRVHALTANADDCSANEWTDYKYTMWVNDIDVAFDLFETPSTKYPHVNLSSWLFWIDAVRDSLNGGTIVLSTDLSYNKIAELPSVQRLLQRVDLVIDL